jgi:signal transduction histidine kinase
MPHRHLFSLSTIQSQITAIILFGLIIIVVGGSMLEQRVGNDYPMLDIDTVDTYADRVFALSSILKTATLEERDVVVLAARRAGWDLTLQPSSLKTTFTTTSPAESMLDAVVDFLFAPDGTQTPVGGWKTFLNGKRVVSAEVDEQTMLVLGGFQDTAFWNELLARGPHYLVALITLIVLFSSFAVRAITRPLRKIAAAAANADITSGRMIFEEKGSVEIVAVARSLNGMSDRITTMIEGRTRMLRGVSHDLRTPLTRLRLRAERACEGELRDMLLADISRIDSLLRDSLRYLRDDYNRETVETVDLASMLQTICNEFSDIGHNVSYFGPNRLPARFKPVAITRAVNNLCENAVKFGSNVEISLGVIAETVVIEVADDGPGIPEALRSRVLEPFYKIDAARSVNNTGFGLGLSIVSEIVQGHAGTLEFLERQPHGLIVRLKIPLRHS